MGFWGDAKNYVFGKDADPANATLKDGQAIRDVSNTRIQDLMGRQAPQADRTQVGNVARVSGQRLSPEQEEWRKRQLAMANRLQGVASGEQAGAGELAARRMGDRGMAQQIAMGSMARGGNAAMGARTAARGVADISQATAGQAQQAALQDQSAANQTLGQLMAQGRGQDVDVSSQNANLMQNANLANMSAENQRVFQQAGLDQATSLANMQAKLSTMGMNDQAILGYLGQMYGVSAAEMQARLAQEQNPNRGIFPDLLATGGTIAAAAASDRNVKTDIKEGDAKLSDLLRSAKPYSYSYTDEKYGEGEHVSPMAQDLETSEIGKMMVEKGPDGVKRVNYGKGLGAMLSGMSWIDRRLAELEKQGK